MLILKKRVLFVDHTLNHIDLMHRYVLDGWPLTKDHISMLTKFRIIPVCVVELNVTDEEMHRRADNVRLSQDRFELSDEFKCHFFYISHYLERCLCMIVLEF